MQILTMNNSELFVAIEAAHKMLTNTDNYRGDRPILLNHLEALLKLQLERAAKEAACPES
jgi:hypothetical protein